MFGSDSCAAATVNGALAANAPTLPAASVARTRNRYDVAVPGTIERTMLVVSAAGSAIGVHVVPRSVEWLTMLGTGAVADGPGAAGAIVYGSDPLDEFPAGSTARYRMVFVVAIAIGAAYCALDADGAVPSRV